MHVLMLWILIDCKNRLNINNAHVNEKYIDETTIHSSDTTCNNVFIQILLTISTTGPSRMLPT